MFIKSFMPHAKIAKDAKIFWTAVAERGGGTAFASHAIVPKRRGASLPAAVQNGLLLCGLCVLGVGNAFIHE